MKTFDFFPVGAVIAYAGPLADTDANANGAINLAQIRANLASAGWLCCDGAPYPQDAFWELFGTIGTAFGSEADGSFNVPDLRGRFIRGVNGGATQPAGTGDPDSQARTTSGNGGNNGDKVGSLQADSFQGHEHNYTDMITAEATVQPGEGPPLYIPNPAPTATTDIDPDSDYGTPRISQETRPTNLYLNYIIRYRGTVTHGA